MPAPEIIHQLVARFTENRAAYRSGKYNEAQLRQEFLDPFFEALGWDVYNKNGYALDYRDVVIEDSLEIEGTSKAPDYAFKIGRERKFYAEAKKPAVDIKYDIHPAYQLRRYAWNAHMALSILTDFEELAVYNCKDKPNPTDSAATSREKLYRYTEYEDKWDEIAEIFSRESVWKGSLDKPRKPGTGTTEVDDAFLKDIEEWRTLLARNLALRNPHISGERQLNFAVQMTIDRIIFLRICEDRGIEPDEQLKELSKSPGIYPRLVELFKKADAKYNSGLFHFAAEKGESTAPDTFTPGLTIDDRVLKEIITSIYYPCPYIFKEIPVEILGQVYEQFLGKVIRLTPGHQAKVEEKPEVRKAGGVYYTPKYIVDYIVTQTVGKLLDGKTPAEAAALKIVDPACGSGSFLLGAFQHLLDWHLNWYTTGEPEKWAKGRNPALVQSAGGGWRLTTEKKKEILVNNIHGVDIDPQAVEVTKLSLLLKVLEEETGQMSFVQERVLPDLGRNIQCGNSLIGEDYFSGRLVVEEGERERVNPFEWQRAFAQVFKQGGFDTVIGNPPYVRQEALGNDKQYFQTHYQVYAGTADLYSYFIERGVSLLAPGGQFSYIVANKWMKASYGEPLRVWLGTKNIEELTDFGDLPVFEGATTYPCIIRISNSNLVKKPWITRVKTLEFESLLKHIESCGSSQDQNQFSRKGWSLADGKVSELLSKLNESTTPLGEYIDGKIYYGIKTGLNDAFVIDEKVQDHLISKDSRSKIFVKPFLLGKDIKRYSSPLCKKYLILIPKGWTRIKSHKASNPWRWFQSNFPAIASHLLPYAKEASKRSDMGEYWWELRACNYYSEFNKPKIIFPDISLGGNFTMDTEGKFFIINTSYIIPLEDWFLLGLLNSSLMSFIYRNISSSYRGGYLRYINQYLVQLPIKVSISGDHNDNPQNKLILLTKKIFSLKKLTQNTPQEIELINREIDAIDREIDRLVYELYGLTEEEIRLVEGE